MGIGSEGAHRMGTKKRKEKFDWEQFMHEPLKNVDITELRKQRSEKDVEKLA